MADASQPTEGHQATPPYIAFQSIKTLAKDMKEHGVPGRIDRSVLTNFSNSVGSQIITALKFLKLTDANSVPTQNLRDLVESHGTTDWAKMVATVLRSSYAPVFQLDLQAASPSQFNERFKLAYPAKDDVFRKCVTFFLNAVREAEIPISSYIMKNKKPRNGTAKRRVTRTPNDQEPGIKKDEAAGRSTPPEKPFVKENTGKTPYEVLMSDIYDPSEMEPDSAEEKAVFVLARFLKKKESA